MEIRLRNAEENDAHLLFQWRNDPVTSENSINQKAITWEEHKNWFDKTLCDPSHIIMIGMTGGDYDPICPVGMVRFDELIDGYEVSITVEPYLRTRGMGRALLKAATERYPNETLFATIRGANVASLIIFLASGFQLVEYNQISGLAYLRREPK